MTADELHARLYPEAHAKEEYIICAAFHFHDGKKYEHQPKNIEEGFVICGRRHHNVFATATLLGFDWKGETKITPGFLTSKDRFVDRKEGGEIAFKMGQIKKQTDCLFSEELY